MYYHEAIIVNREMEAEHSDNAIYPMREMKRFLKYNNRNSTHLEQHYELRSHAGAGSFGTVRRARNVDQQQLCAIKIVKFSDWRQNTR